mgnify:CR=1 FL=1
MKTCLFYGFNSLLKNNTSEDALETVKNMGFDAVEPLHDEAIYTPDKLKELKHALSQKKLSVACYSVCVDLRDDSQLEVFKNALNNAKELNSPYIHFTLIPTLSKINSIDEYIDTVSDRARRAAALAKDYGIRALIENQGYVFNGAASIRRLFEKVGSDNLFFCSDLGNSIFVDENPIDTAKAFTDITRHVHIKDYRYTDGSAKYTSVSGRNFFEVMPGTGDLPLKKCLKLYKDRDTAFSFEYSGGTDEIKKALCNIQSMLK